MQIGVDYFVAKLDPTHQSSKFSVGEDSELRALKSFLQRNALDFQSANVAVTYVAFLPPAEPNARPRIIGYITLTCSEVDLGNTYVLEDCEPANRYACMPALKIARLATHARYLQKGIGKSLMDFAVALAADHIGLSVGCRFLVTDAKSRSVSFYLGQGFTLLDTEENKSRSEPVMFLDLNKLLQTDDSSEMITEMDVIPADA